MKSLSHRCVVTYQRWSSSFRMVEPFEQGRASPNAVERPSPIVFLAGEGLTHEIWRHSADYFSSRGFCTLSISEPDLTTEKAVDFLQESISSRGLTSPVLVAHSASTFLAQKFLESYSVQGLALVAPWPPRSGRLAIVRRMAWEETVMSSGDGSDSSYNDMMLWRRVLRYHGHQCSNNSDDDDGLMRMLVKENMTLPLILQELSEHGDELDLNLEFGVVPTLLVMTAADVAQVTDEERSALLLQHAVPDEWLLSLPDSTGLPMLHPESRDRMNSKLLEFIEEIL